MQIAVLTGGGDCPGLNAAIRAVVRRALDYNYEVLGVHKGWAGLLNEGDAEALTAKTISGILPVGGTMLSTSRTNPMRDERHMHSVMRNIEKLGIDALVAIGGDDTLSVAYSLHQRGVHVVGVPKTMDNDISETDYCIGFDSAVTTVVDALDKLHTTASAHHRVMVVEVMGRDAGWVATFGGLAGGADYILIPEQPASIDSICQHLANRRALGKSFSIIVVAEGAILTDVEAPVDLREKDAFGHVRLDRRAIGEIAAREIERRTGFEARATVLGHLQRGGSPSVFDRVLATRLGVAAVDYVRDGKFGHMPALKGNRVVPVLLKDAIAQTRTVDGDLYELAKVFF
ncbi:MAG: 6-phosphofructokinase [Chloroflexi bacterium]|nr:6-phosphofructokinase [Chloroflexota bacterium]